jgi:pyruvate,orthophosphate dikinase
LSLVVDDLPLLMALRVQGVAPAERVAAAMDCHSEAAAARLAALCADELAVERTGRVAGFALTPDGSEALSRLLGAEGLCAHHALTECYERFLGLNKRVLEVSSDWQVRRDGGVEIANDHSDPDYDSSVIDRLAELHDGAKVCLSKIAAFAPRFAPYKLRLDRCVERLFEGDRRAFTAPLAESYHTVWFELHQDLLLTLGLKREE